MNPDPSAPDREVQPARMRSIADLRALPVVAALLDPHELDGDTAEHLLAVLLDPAGLAVIDHELNVTSIVVDLEAGTGRIEDLIAPDHVTVAVPELLALLRAHLCDLGRDPDRARRRPARNPDRRWITPPSQPPEEAAPPF